MSVAETGGGQPDGEPAFTPPTRGTLPSTIAIIGLGLMGGSLALALRAAEEALPHQGAPVRILGITRSRATLDAALARGAIDTGSDQLTTARDADLLVLGAPVRTILHQLPLLAEIARDGALVLDMGSTKEAVVRAMNQLPERIFAVGGHPMCGKEVAGFAAAEADLFRDKLFVLTPTSRSTPQALGGARALAEMIGSRVIELDAARHDRLVGAVSHLPYLAAANLVNTVEALAAQDDRVWEIAASGFRDTTRVAASDEQMILDILMTNRENVVAQMREYARRFGEFADALADGDEAALRARIERAAQTRRAWRSDADKEA